MCYVLYFSETYLFSFLPSVNSYKINNKKIAGASRPVDNCPRSEVKLPDGQCYGLLTQGPCALAEYVLLDPATNQGYCAPRLCAPDRIFIFSDQMCHDPRNINLCPREFLGVPAGRPSVCFSLFLPASLLCSVSPSSFYYMM